jgi:hypothetical protein
VIPKCLFVGVCDPEAVKTKPHRRKREPCGRYAPARTTRRPDRSSPLIAAWLDRRPLFTAGSNLLDRSAFWLNFAPESYTDRTVVVLKGPVDGRILAIAGAIVD